jgi:hypothetical protein
MSQATAVPATSIRKNNMTGKPQEKKKKDVFVDDGRVIANMNVDGMPRSPFRRKAFDEFGARAEKREEIRLTRPEKRAVAGGVFLSYLLFGIIFFGGLALFIWFCVSVWFK